MIFTLNTSSHIQGTRVGWELTVSQVVTRQQSVRPVNTTTSKLRSLVKPVLQVIVCLCVWLSVCLSACLFVCQTVVCLLVCLSVYLSVCMSVCIFVRPSIIISCFAGYTCEVGATDYQNSECKPGHWCAVGSSKISHCLLLPFIVHIF